MREIYQKNITGSITRPANINQYTADDAVSDTSSDAHFTLTHMGRGGGTFSGLIEGAYITSTVYHATVRPDLELWLFNTDITVVTDADPFTVTDAELGTLMGIIDFPVADWKEGGSNTVCYKELQVPFVATSSNIIYGQLVVRNTYTPASGEVFKLNLVIRQD